MSDQPAHPWEQPLPESGQPADGARHAAQPPAGATPGQPGTVAPPPVGNPQAHYAPPASTQYGQPHPGQPPLGYAQPPAQYSPYGQPQPGHPAGFAPSTAYAPAAMGLAPRKPALLGAALPMSGLPFVAALRPLEARVGRWFLAWAIALGFFATGQVLSLALMLPGFTAFFSSIDPADLGNNQTQLGMDFIAEVIGTPLGMAAVNVAWAAMIPGTIVAIAAFGKRAAGFASSVVGRWRWSAVGRAAIVLAPIFAIYIGLSLWLDPSIEWTWNPNWGLVAIVLLTTPLQATGEEFTFRGLLPQMMAGWRAHRYVPALVMLFPVLLLMMLQPATWWLSLLALVAAAVGPWVLRGAFGSAIWTGISTGLLFGAMHAHPSIAATLQLSLVGFTCSMITHRTGGLEAASVLHTANNVFIMVPLALTGTSAFSAQPVAGEDWMSTVITALALGLAYVAVHFTMQKFQRATEGNAAADLLEPQRLQPAGPDGQPQQVGLR